MKSSPQSDTAAPKKTLGLTKFKFDIQNLLYHDPATRKSISHKIYVMLKKTDPLESSRILSLNEEIHHDNQTQ
jgi:hypothetical protein